MARKLVSFSCMAGSILMGTGLAWGEVNNDCVSSSDCNRICKIGSCVFVEGGGGHCEYAPLICDDGDPCTDDACNGGVCEFVERFCNSDNLFCTVDFCDGLGTCRDGVVSPCAPPTPECENFGQTNTGRCVECTDNTHCAGNEVNDQCNLALGECVECLENPECEASDPTRPFCINGVCKECLTFSDCDDIACMQVECWGDNECHFLDDCSVDDGLFCNGVEICNTISGICDPGVDQCTAPGQTCDEINDECIGCTVQNPCEQDAHACTTHTCDLSGGVGVCVVTTDDSVCVDDGLFCTGAEVCDAQLGCVSEGDPCSDPTPICFETSDSCGNCTSDADCEDNIVCTVDTCVNNLCQNTDDCEDGNLCNGIESCNPADGLCSDGDDVICTPERPICLPESGTCIECLGGFDSGCNDGDPCTEDRCLLTNTCIHIPDSDGDGVPNCCDNCPDTIGTADIQCNGTWLNPGDPGCVCDNPYPPACAGDPPVEGCSCYQLDSDGDGLNDCGKGGDSCPCDTGCPEKGDGCPCYPGEPCCSTDPLSLCYCAP